MDASRRIHVKSRLHYLLPFGAYSVVKQDEDDTGKEQFESKETLALLIIC